MPIMRAPAETTKTFKVPCSGEGIFVAINLEIKLGSLKYWNGTSMETLDDDGNLRISSIIVQYGVATVVVSNLTGSYDSSTRVCFIPGNPVE